MFENFSGDTNQKYLDWYVFSSEFNAQVLSKDYSEIDKLRILKQNVKGDAFELIKNFHKPEEAMLAFRLLDTTYGDSDMVIRECVSNLHRLKPVFTESDIKGSKALV